MQNKNRKAEMKRETETETEKRGSERFAVRQFKNVYRQQRAFPYRVVNISKTGCAVESRMPLEEREGKILFDLPLPSRTQSLSLEARIVRECRFDEETGTPSILYGIRFEAMDHLSGLILDAYLGFLRRDTHIAQLEDAWEKLRKVQERIEMLIACEERKEVSYIH
jgi:hypothetical protein